VALGGEGAAVDWSSALDRPVRPVVFPLTAGEKRFFSPERHHSKRQKMLYINILSVICQSRTQRNFGLKKRGWQRTGSGILRHRSSGGLVKAPGHRYLLGATLHLFREPQIDK